MFQITNENVQIWTLYATVGIAIIGFLFNIFSLWQTKKATEDMAKPFVNVYVDRYAVKSQEKIYVIKNFGQTPAYIDDIQLIDGELDELNQKRLFQSLIGNMLAPNQRLTSSIHPHFNSVGVIKITYHDRRKNKYSDKFKLDTSMATDLYYSVSESNKAEEIPSAIRQSTMALLRDLR
ncbi:hypothetical protein [Streptococcus parauberis]|uniref:hypothetical protein n=1 Tax=Streptococcus parauberis TaxID=1348 RepID=UPI000789ABA0|nr:hypothetical protein [Streptococcus parauberis]KYP21668.1 hypothetical protein AKL14_00579 [Streptococcus parauberis]KYP21843.1 hypothetical protein AKL13_00343 [Streptococcus parauberis]KYP21939.1 hypothetical protein TN39_00188 [Streptococcus parauberis]KYP23735.1 hypothetical protein ADO04_01611 [Streptococcus parauberis]KYP25352.1 hypothetical protein TP84_01654 [Streptococcus parauberis]